MTETMGGNIAKLDDEDLTKELSFAEGFAPTPNEPAAEQWLRLLRLEGARRDARAAHDDYVRAAEELHDTNTVLLGRMIEVVFPSARVIITEGLPSDEIGGVDRLELVAVTDADGRVLADRGTPDDRFDKLRDDAEEALSAIIEIDPEMFPQQTWSLP